MFQLLKFPLFAFMMIRISCAEKCACATGNVHVREGAGVSHTSLGILTPGECVTYKGNKVNVGSMPWAHVQYKGHNGYATTQWVKIEDCPASHGSTSQGSHSATTHGSTSHTSKQQLSGCPHIVSRAEWGARAPTRHQYSMPATPLNVYIHHGASAACHDKATCKAIVRSYQNYHMNTHGWDDIGYTFIIGEDGNVYEGRGWGIIGTHTLNHNSDGLGFCVIGNFVDHVPNAAAIKALKQLITCGAKHGKIRSNYKIYGHRDVRATACPGQKFYNVIKDWPHFYKHH